MVWDFSGTGTLTTTPPVAGAPNGTVTNSGHATFAPQPSSETRDEHGRITFKPSTLYLHVTRPLREPKNAQIDIDFEPETEVLASIGDASATCVNGVLTTTAHMNGYAGITLAAVGVAPGNRRTAIDVTRDDPRRPGEKLVAHITPERSSDALAGLPINGDWVLSSPLLPSETCDGDHPVLPNNLIVRAYGSCPGG